MVDNINRKDYNLAIVLNKRQKIRKKNKMARRKIRLK
jgi:hypothetical protein